MTGKKTRCLVVIQLEKSCTFQRITQDGPKIVAYLSRLSNAELEVAFRSIEGHLFGFFLMTNSPHFL